MATITPGETFASGEEVTAARLNNLVSGASITNIQASDIASGAVTEAKIGALAVSSGKIAAGAVSGPKIAMGSDAQGDILFRGSANYERLAAGTANYPLLSGGAGADPSWAQLPEGSLAAGAVDQSALKTSTGEVSASSNDDEVTLPGGTYGFYPQIKITGGAGTGIWTIGGYGGSACSPGATYVTNIGFGDISSETAYAQQRYVTASGKDPWVFLKVAKKNFKYTNPVRNESRQIKKGEIVGTYYAPDHPSVGNGSDENAIEHPWRNLDTSLFEVILVDNDDLAGIKEKAVAGKSVAQVIHEELEIDESAVPVYTPREIVEIDEEDNLPGETVKEMRTPEHWKTVISAERIKLKRRMVEVLPSSVKLRKLKAKS